jgi:glucose/arabinose dehydrogenase
MLMRLRGRLSLLVLALGLLLAGTLGTPVASAGVTPSYPEPFFYSTQTTFGFAQPIGMAVAPDGRIFITDDAGTVWTSMGGGAKAQPIFDLTDHVNEKQDRGLVSVAVDKNYAFNRRIYLAYTFEDRSKAELEGNSSLVNLPKTQRLVWVTVPESMELVEMGKNKKVIKLEAEPEDEDLKNDEHVVIGSYSSDPKRPGVPFSTEHACPQPNDLVNGDWSTSNESDCIPDDSDEHTIDSVRVDPNDGTLWVSVGEGSDGGSALDPGSWRSQRSESYSGKLLHVSTTGEGLPGHPFCPSDEDLTDVCTKVYAKGFRNPFRFFFRPSPDGRPTIADAGWSTREELDLAEKGKNYGWPCREGKGPTPTWSERPECQAIAPSAFTEPVYDYASLANGAILGGVTYEGTGGPKDYPNEYKGAIFISDVISNQVVYLRLNEAGTAVEPGYPKVFANNLQAVDWAPAPNGDLMYVDLGFSPSEFAQIRRISYDAENVPPEAVATADKTFGPLKEGKFTVKFDGSKSSDANGDELTYKWDFNEDGEADKTSDKPTAEWTFTKSANTEVTLTVDDGKEATDADSIEIFAGDEPPEPSFDSGQMMYTDGEEITLNGSAEDPEDGTLEADDLSWQVTLNHNGSHPHPWTNPKGVDTVKFTTDTAHDAPSFYEVELTAKDSRGLETTIMRELTAITKLVRIDSSPEGAPIGYGGVNYTTPFEKQSTIGLITTLSTVPSFSQSGSDYEFESWSDGGERIHDLVIPNKDVSLTASYNLIPAKLFKLTVSKSGTGKVTSSPAGIDCGATCSAEFEEGKVVELKQEASPGSEFKEWSGACTGTGACKVTMTETKSVGAKFEKLGGDTGGGGPKGGPVGDTSAATLAFDPTHGLANKRKAVLRGTAGDASGLKAVQVALRQARKVKGRCRWWSQGKGDFPKGTASCAHPTYMKAKLKGAGEQVSWALPLGGHLPAGRYLLFFRTLDGAGNPGAGPNGSKPLPLLVAG